jgi:hypothetical protein
MGLNAILAAVVLLQPLSTLAVPAHAMPKRALTMPPIWVTTLSEAFAEARIDNKASMDKVAGLVNKHEVDFSEGNDETRELLEWIRNSDSRVSPHSKFDIEGDSDSDLELFRYKMDQLAKKPSGFLTEEEHAELQRGLAESAIEIEEAARDFDERWTKEKKQYADYMERKAAKEKAAKEEAEREKGFESEYVDAGSRDLDEDEANLKAMEQTLKDHYAGKGGSMPTLSVKPTASVTSTPSLTSTAATTETKLAAVEPVDLNEHMVFDKHSTKNTKGSKSSNGEGRKSNCESKISKVKTGAPLEIKPVSFFA